MTLTLDQINDRLSQISINDTNARKYWISLRDKYLERHAEEDALMRDDVSKRRRISRDEIEQDELTSSAAESDEDTMNVDEDDSSSSSSSSPDEEEVEEYVRMAQDEDVETTTENASIHAKRGSFSSTESPVSSPRQRKRKSMELGSSSSQFDNEWQNLEKDVSKSSTLEDFEENQEQFRAHLTRRREQLDRMMIPEDNISKAIMDRLHSGDITPEELSHLMQQLQQQEHDLSRSLYNLDEEESTLSSEDHIEDDVKRLEVEMTSESSSPNHAPSHEPTPSLRDICCLAPDAKQEMQILQYMEQFERMAKGFQSLKRVFASFGWHAGHRGSVARATANDPVKHQQRYSDKMVTQFESGKVVIEKFASQTKKTILPNGHIVTRFSNGDMRRVILGQRVEKYIERLRMYHVLHVKDKSEVFYHLASRRCETKLPNGVSLILSAASESNQCRIYSDAERRETIFANGTKQVHHYREGIKEILLPTGQYFVKLVPAIDLDNVPTIAELLEKNLAHQDDDGDSNSDTPSSDDEESNLDD